MVYSLENIRFLKRELVRFSAKYEELRQNMAELKRRAGLDPDAPFPPHAESVPSAAPAPDPEPRNQQSCAWRSWLPPPFHPYPG